ncbi:ADP-ribosyltransferase [Barnesiella intestinihominis]|uniref:ADP-ribosyltransferase n=1 Tax=Barnesiella intestinihominis TaxID=487174 RepID=UPI00189751BF|nr:ADP-ribosyltransferase [Barnesiella intestinihominis]MDB0676077.1 ADP-ribosyltransferase [Barnesiella intestinihominis]
MAKPKTPNQKRKYGELNKRIAKYVMLVESIYEDLNLEAAKIVGITDFTIDSDRPFMWSDYPQTRKRIRDLQERFVEDIGAVIYSGTSEEWKNSNEVQDLLANKVLQTYGATIGKEKYEILYQPNNDALKAFQQRKDKGFTISDKLWNQSTLYKQELEEAISCAIQKGTSAITLSKQISKYLLDFPQLQKDYKERFGKASRAIDCEYRSIRLAASEINMAYRQAENLRWQQMDFVVGYEIKLSNNHTCNGKPFQDICDILAGKYPKDFQWTGWHPLCRCYKIPILKTEEEFWEWDGRSEATTASVNEVKDVPDAFKKWINENIQRAKSWDSAPYFIRDNDKYIREDFKVNVYNKTEKTFVRKRRTNLAMSRVEYYNKIYPHIPEVQQAAVNAYTQAISSGNKGATSREINRRLRNGTEDEYVDVASRLISQALSRLPKYEGVVYRGETMSIKKLQERFLDHIGDVVSDKGFISSSLYMDTPMKFISHAGIPKSHKRVIFEIQSKNGRNISKISEFNGIFTLENQHEILFDKGTKFLVKKRRIEGDGTYRIILVEQ